MVDANWVGLPGTAMHNYGAHSYFRMGQRFMPREMLLIIMCAAASYAMWFLLAKVSRGPRNIMLAIIVAITVAHQFGPLDLVTKGVVTGFLVFPGGMFFIGCGFVAYSTYELLGRGSRRCLAEAAFGIFALVPALRVFAGIRPYGYSIYLAMPLFLVFLIAISRCIKAATPALSADRQQGLVNYLLAAEVVMLAPLCIPQTSERMATLELLTARLITEYGADYFGIDYDQEIYHWIEANYRIAGEFGRFHRDHNNTFAAMIYQRRDPVERNSTGAIISDRPS